MSNSFFTLKEAQDFTGKSRSTLRRFVESIAKTDGHADRHYLKPPPDEVTKLKEDNQPFSWRISQELLTREFQSTQQTSQPKSGGVSDGDRIITVLEDTVAVLREELNVKNQQIAEFQERQREQNVLLRNLSDQLALSAPAKSTDVVVDAEVNGAPARQSDDAPKKSFWRRDITSIFGLNQS